MEFLNKKNILILLIIFIFPTIVSAYDEGNYEEEKNVSLYLPLVPLIDEKATEPEGPRPPIDNPEDIPEVRERMIMERITNPNQVNVPLCHEVIDEIIPNPMPTDTPTPAPSSRPIQN